MYPFPTLFFLLISDGVEESELYYDIYHLNNANVDPLLLTLLLGKMKGL